MKNTLLLLGFGLSAAFISTNVKAQSGKPETNANKTEKPVFNKELATSLGADKYGMKNYVIVMLTPGSAKVEDKAKMGELMKGHLANIQKLADEGKIVVAGPFFEKNKQNFRGMFIFDTKSKEEAEQWVKTDPAVQANVFGYEILPWYGSAALPLYLKHHAEISQENP